VGSVEGSSVGSHDGGSVEIELVVKGLVEVPLIGWMVGFEIGGLKGSADGTLIASVTSDVGSEVGDKLGSLDGIEEGDPEGSLLVCMSCLVEGQLDGFHTCAEEGLRTGCVGSIEGFSGGSLDGGSMGSNEGFSVGSMDRSSVGSVLGEHDAIIWKGNVDGSCEGISSDVGLTEGSVLGENVGLVFKMKVGNSTEGDDGKAAGLSAKGATTTVGDKTG